MKSVNDADVDVKYCAPVPFYCHTDELKEITVRGRDGERMTKRVFGKCLSVNFTFYLEKDEMQIQAFYNNHPHKKRVGKEVCRRNG